MKLVNHGWAFAMTAALLMSCSQRATSVSKDSLAGKWNTYTIDNDKGEEDQNILYEFARDGKVNCFDMDRGNERSISGSYVVSPSGDVAISFPGRQVMFLHITYIDNNVMKVMSTSSENAVFKRVR
jgi:hypothetical protein